MRVTSVFRMLCLLAVAGIAIAAGASAAVAQDATPVVECVAPELPPGTPTPVEDGSPVAVEEEPAPEAVDEERTNIEGPARPEQVELAQAGLDNLLACIASGNLDGVAALMTPNLIQWLTGTDNPHNVPLMMQGMEPMRIVATGEPVGDQDHRIGLHIVFGGFFNVPGALTSERWYFVRDGDHWKVDEIVAAPAPEGFMPEATIVDVALVDFAFSLSMSEIPAGPVIFRMTNTSYSGAPHVGVLVTLAEGLTAEEVIQMDALPEDEMTGFFGATFLEPGQSADMIFEDLQPGVYTLVCDVATPSGVEHWMLGMVAQFDVV
jgi:hypothetical protein